MLRKLFKKQGLESRDPAVRIAYVRALDHDAAKAQEAALKEAALTDPDAEVQRAAFARLDVSACAALLSACTTSADRKRLAQFVNEREDLIGAEPLTADGDTLLACVAASSNEHLQRWLRHAKDPDQLADIILGARQAQRDQLATLKPFRGPDYFHALERASRGRDKTLNRLARENLQSIKNAEGERTSASERRRQIAERVAALLADPGAEEEARRTHLVALKQEFDSHSRAELKAISELHNMGVTAPPDLSADPFAGVDLEPPKADPYRELLDQLPNPARINAENLADYRRVVTATTRSWHQLRDAGEAPSPEVAAEFAERQNLLTLTSDANERLQLTLWPKVREFPDRIPDDAEAATTLWQELSGLDFWLDAHTAIEEQLAWPTQLPKPQTLLDELDKRRQVRELKAALQQEAAALRTKIEQDLDRVHKLIDDGASEQAKTQLQTVRNTSARLPEDQCRGLEKRLRAASARFAELKDWQAFATSPKREALIEDLKRLQAADFKPDKVADRLKALRKEWRALGRPASRADHELQARFDELAEATFEPCRQHFAAEAKRREENALKRESLLKALEHYLDETDWQTADYQAAEQIMRTGRAEWQDAFPVPRGHDKKVSARFETAQERLHELIKAHWAKNLEAKAALVEEARTLRENATVPEQVEGLKVLQRRWKDIGTAPHRQEQKLWRELRKICDAAFGEREQAHTAAQQAFDERILKAQQLLQEHRQRLCEGPPQDGALREFEQRFAELGDIPARHVVQQERRKLTDEFREAAAAARRSQHTAKILACAEEDARLAGDPHASSTHPWFASREDCEDDVLAQLQELALTAEIVAEIPSPAEQSAARMAIQVELMNTGAARALPDPESLAKTWCRIANKPVHEDVSALRQRFFGALEASLARV